MSIPYNPLAPVFGPIKVASAVTASTGTPGIRIFVQDPERPAVHKAFMWFKDEVPADDPWGDGLTQHDRHLKELSSEFDTEFESIADAVAVLNAKDDDGQPVHSAIVEFEEDEESGYARSTGFIAIAAS